MTELKLYTWTRSSNQTYLYLHKAIIIWTLHKAAFNQVTRNNLLVKSFSLIWKTLIQTPTVKMMMILNLKVMIVSTRIKYLVWRSTWSLHNIGYMTWSKTLMLMGGDLVREAKVRVSIMQKHIKIRDVKESLLLWERQVRKSLSRRMLMSLMQWSKKRRSSISQRRTVTFKELWTWSSMLMMTS